MTDTWDGRPPGAAAERDGWHWLAQGKQPVLMWWNAEYQVWPSVRRDITPSLAAHYYGYLGPCLTPAEIAALTAAAAEAMRERAARHLDNLGWRESANEIRALPLPDAGAALSEALAAREAAVRADERNALENIIHVLSNTPEEDRDMEILRLACGGLGRTAEQEIATWQRARGATP